MVRAHVRPVIPVLLGVVILLALSTARAGGAPTLHCGDAVEFRWPVKTLSDSSAGLVNLKPVNSSVEALLKLRAPSRLPQDTRLPQETRTYTIKAVLVGVRLQADHDYHLIVRGLTTGATMITEIADPACSGADHSRVLPQLIQARSYLEHHILRGPGMQSRSIRAQARLDAGPPHETPGHFRKMNRRVTLTGVLFFDTVRGQLGVAPNGVELHPVLSIK